MFIDACRVSRVVIRVIYRLETRSRRRQSVAYRQSPIALAKAQDSVPVFFVFVVDRGHRITNTNKNSVSTICSRWPQLMRVHTRASPSRLHSDALSIFRLARLTLPRLGAPNTNERTNERTERSGAAEEVEESSFDGGCAAFCVALRLLLACCTRHGVWSRTERKRE